MSRALVLAPAWVGDMVMAHTLVQLLKAQFAEIYVAAPQATRLLATRMSEVTQTLEHSFSHGAWAFRERQKLGRAWREYDFSAAYILQNGWKHALVPYFAAVPIRVGWLGEWRYGLLNRCQRLNKADYPLMVERFMALASETFALPEKPYPQPRLRVDGNNQQGLLQQHHLPSDKPFVALCPGAEGGPSKRWSPDRYAALAQTLVARGHGCWLFGGPRDRPVCERIQSKVPEVVNLAGRTSLVDAVDLLAMARAIVSNDSGLMHVGCAVGVPTLGIYGATSPQFTPPLGEGAQVLEGTIACRPCHKPVCRFGHYGCLDEISVADVVARLPA